MKSSPVSGLAASVLFGIGLFSMTASGVDAQTAGSPSLPAGMGGGSSAGAAAAAGPRSASGQGAAPAILPRDFSLLRVEPGDLLTVDVYDEPEFSQGYRVDPEGNLTIPLCGKVKVQGLTSAQTARVVETALKDGQILNQPQVTVDIQQYSGQYVTVLGEVSVPGRVPVIGPTRLSEVLAQSGGVTALAGTHVRIRHGDDESTPETDALYLRSESNQQTGSILVRPGDTVVVPRAGIIYVLGAVQRPGGYVMQEDGKLNVAQALALSGGTILQAKTNGLRVIRRNADGTIQDIALSYDGIANGTQTPIELQAQDIVYVPISKIKAILSDSTGIISTAISSTIYTTH